MEKNCAVNFNKAWGDFRDWFRYYGAPRKCIPASSWKCYRKSATERISYL